jgi:hypothetical protein
MKNMSSMIYFTLALFTFFAHRCFADDVIQDPATKQFFPSTVTFHSSEGDELSLQVTGTATRSKFFVKIYTIAHYMQGPFKGNRTELFNEILTVDSPKQATVRWVYEIEGKKIKDGYLDSFQKVLTSEQMNALSMPIDAFLALVQQDVKIKSEHIFRWLPGELVEVFFEGEKIGTIKHPGFPQALWSIWFAQKSVVNRNELISLIVQ